MNLKERKATKAKLLISSNDIKINYEKWNKPNESNILFITGLSGSGKSTLGFEIAEKQNAEYFSMDVLLAGMPELSNTFIREIFNRYPEYEEFCRKVREGIMFPYPESIKIAPKLINAMIQSARSCYLNKTYIVEGFQIYAYCSPEHMLGMPLIVKSTSILKSLMRRLKRDEEHIIHWNPIITYSRIIRYYKWYTRDNNQIEKLVKTMRAGEVK